MKESLFSGLLGSLLKLEGGATKFHTGGLVTGRGTDGLWPYQREMIESLTIPRRERKMSPDTRTMLDDLERAKTTMSGVTRMITLTVTADTIGGRDRRLGKSITMKMGNYMAVKQRGRYSTCEECDGSGCGDGDNGVCTECNGYGEVRELP